MIIKAVRFKREENSEWEMGISIECNGNMDNKIIDSNGDLVTSNDGKCPIWDGKDDISTLCINTKNLLQI